MKQLADGDTSARIPATRARDEIGAMARTVIVFRDTMIERERLTAAQAEITRARKERGEAIAVTISVSKCRSIRRWQKCAGRPGGLKPHRPTSTAPPIAVSAESRTAEERVGFASGNVTAAATSVEELAASISEIAEQATRSTDVATARSPRQSAPRGPWRSWAMPRPASAR